MQRPPLFVRYAALAALTAHSSIAVADDCSPQWRDNLPPINDTVFAAITWDSDGAGPQPPLLILAGDFSTIGTVAASHVAAFDGHDWAALANGLNGRVRALAVYNDQLIAGGDFTLAGEVAASNVAVWDGAAWAALGAGINNDVMALAVYSAELYAGGQFQIDGARSVARWTGTIWSPVGGGMSLASCPATCATTVNALAVYNGNLVAAGYFDRAGGITANRIARWDGLLWHNLDGGIRNGDIFCLAVHNGQVAVGGIFTAVGGISVPASYVATTTGPNWWALGGGMNWAVNSLAVHDGVLFAGGSFTLAEGSPAAYVAQWDGDGWSALGAGMNSTVYALTEYEGDIVAGGSFTMAGGASSERWARWGPPLPQISSQPAPQELTVGDAATFSVIVPDSTGTPSFSWRKDGVVLEDDGFHILGSDSATLMISPAGSADTGQYDVVATDNCGSVVSAPATLTVNCPGLVASDLDRDCDVDGNDLTEFLICMTGPGMTPPTSAGCPYSPEDPEQLLADIDNDGDADLGDFASFQSCFSGENVPATTNCTE